MVSIIIPVYNGEKYIKKCMNFLRNESTKLDVEIIVVDDCSTDNSLNILKQYDFIKLVKNNENKGPSYSRNQGLKVAIGEYVTLLDIDDYYAPNRLLDMYNFCKANGCIICSDMNLNVSETGTPRSLYPNFINPFFSYKRLSLVDFIKIDCGPLKPFINLDFLRKESIFYDENIKYSEDFDFYYKIVKKCGCFILRNQHTNIRFIHSDSLSQNKLDLYKQTAMKALSYISKTNVKENTAIIQRVKKTSKLLFCEVKDRKIRRNFFSDFVKFYSLLLYKSGIIK